MHAPQSEPATVGPEHPPLSILCFLYVIITARDEFTVVKYEDELVANLTSSNEARLIKKRD